MTVVQHKTYYVRNVHLFSMFCLLFYVCMYCSSHTEPLCSRTVQFVPSSTETDVWGGVGSSVELNCTVLLYSNNSEAECPSAYLHWNKDGEPFLSPGSFTQNTSQW